MGVDGGGDQQHEDELDRTGRDSWRSGGIATNRLRPVHRRSKLYVCIVWEMYRMIEFASMFVQTLRASSYTPFLWTCKLWYGPGVEICDSTFRQHQRALNPWNLMVTDLRSQAVRLNPVGGDVGRCGKSSNVENLWVVGCRTIVGRWWMECERICRSSLCRAAAGPSIDFAYRRPTFHRDTRASDSSVCELQSTMHIHMSMRTAYVLQNFAFCWNQCHIYPLI